MPSGPRESARAGKRDKRLGFNIDAELSHLRRKLISIKLDLAMVRLRLALKAGFDPSQPRDANGRWTDTGGGGRVLRELADSAEWASGRSRGPTRVVVNGRTFELTPGQAARLAAAEARADAALARVRERDPDWRPRPALRENVEGHIRAVEAEAREAEARLAELQRVGIGPGRFAAESIPARGPERDFRVEERAAVNGFGRDTGCHTCGTKDPGTKSGNFIPDHQLPNTRNPLGLAQRLFPQCLTCSRFQGRWIGRQRGQDD